MEKKRLIKTALCLVLAFTMTFAPIFSSYAVIATALAGETQVTESQEPAATDEAAPSEEGTTAEDPQPGAGDAAAPTEEVQAQPSKEPASGTVEDQDVQPEEEAVETEEEEEKAVWTEYVWKDEKVKVTAKLSDASIIPDDAEFVVTPVNNESEGYNYDAYMEALNKDSNTERNESNTMLYDVAFIKDGVELQPESGKVSVTFEFLDKQLAETIGAKKAADVNVIHLPLTDEIKDKYDTTADAKKIEAEDINVQSITAEDNNLKVSVKNEKVVFKTDNFSVFAYTVDFEYNGYKFSMPGEGTIKLSEVFKQLHIDKDVKNVEKVTFSNPELVEVKEPSLLSSEWMLVSKKAFSTEETLTVEMKDGESLEIYVTDAQERSVTITLYEQDGTTIATDTGLGSDSNYCILVSLKDKDGNVIGYQEKYINASELQGYEWNYSDSSFKIPNTYDGSTISYDESSGHSISVRLYVNDNIYYNPTDYNSIINFNDTIPGYTFKETVTEGTTTSVSMKKAYPASYQVQITIDEGVSDDDLDGLKLYAEAVHKTTGTDKYTAPITSASDTVVLYDPKRDPKSTWDENPGGAFSGNETTSAIVKDSNGNSIPNNTYIDKGSYGLLITYGKRTVAEDASIQETKYTDHIIIKKLTFDNALNPYDVLGEGAEFGVVANMYRQNDDSETNFAANVYKNPSTIQLKVGEKGSAGDLMVPFYVGRIDEGGLRIGQETTNDCDVYINKDDVDKVTNEETKITVNTIPMDESAINEIVNGYIAKLKSSSADYAQKTTYTPTYTGNQDKRNIDTSMFPDNTTIYVDPRNMDLSQGGGTITKLPGQTIVFNISDENVKISQFYVQEVNADGTPKGNAVFSNTGANGGDADSNRRIEEAILNHIVFNAYNATKLELFSGPAGLFLAPRDGVEVKQDSGSGTGWIATAGDFYQNGGEWHFFRTQRRYKAEGDFTLRGIKKLSGDNDLGDKQFEFTLYKIAEGVGDDITQINPPVEIETAKSAKNTGQFDFKTIKYTQNEVPKGTYKDYYYRIVEKEGSYTDVNYDADPVTIRVHAYDRDPGEHGSTSDEGIIDIQVFIVRTFDGQEIETEVPYSTEEDKKVFEIGNFVNSVNNEASGHTHAEVAKHLTGKTLEAGKFSFTISAEDNAPMKDANGAAITTGLTVTNGAEGAAVQFPEFYYTEADAGHTYIYKIVENSFSIPGYSRDTENGPEEIYAKVEVGSDKGDGTLNDSTVTYYSDKACTERTCEVAVHKQV